MAEAAPPAGTATRPPPHGTDRPDHESVGSGGGCSEFARRRRSAFLASRIVPALFAAGPGASPEAAAEPLRSELRAPEADTLTIARLRYEGGGDWYADPTSRTSPLAAIRERTGIAVAGYETVLRPLDPALSDHPYLYMTGHGDVRFSPQERAALRSHLELGGFLHVDDNYGLDESFREEISRIFPETELVELPPEHPVFHAFYALPEGLPKIHEHDGDPPQAFGILLDGRLAVFYSYQSDLGDGWEDASVHEDAPELREAALRMGVNLFVYALGQAVR